VETRLRRSRWTGGSGFICIRLFRPFKLSKSQLGQTTNKDKPEVQTVLVSVDSVEHLRKAYPNYFLDISEFVSVLKKILA
jgi:hypothetical protein